MLIKDINDVKKYVGINVNNSFDTIKGALADAEMMFIIPVLGQELYDLLNDRYSKNNLNEDEQAIFPLLQNAIVKFAYAIYSPEGQIQITDKGYQIASSDHYKQAFEWMVNRADQAFLQKAYVALESLVKKMIYVIGNDSQKFNGWLNSPEHNRFFGHFINYSDEFSTYRKINGRQTYLAMLDSLADVEDEIIIPNISRGLADLLQQDVTAHISESEDYEEKSAELLRLVRKTLARGTVAMAYDKMWVENTENGLQVKSFKATNGGNSTNADLQTIERARLQAVKSMESALAQLRDYLNNTASSSVFIEYYNSPLYKVPGTVSGIKLNNDPTNKIFKAF